MNAPARSAHINAHTQSAAHSALERRLRQQLRGAVMFDRASRGRYATDASIYQIEPVGVVVPVDEADALLALQIAIDSGVPVLPRGGGTSQCGQTVGEALIIDVSKHLNGLMGFDRDARTVTVQPGMVLDHLNAYLKPHGLWFPVDVSTSAQATIGGMAGNNSCGSRSLAYGNMVHNVLGIDAVLADGTQHAFGVIPSNWATLDGLPDYQALVTRLVGIAQREAAEIELRYPKLLRRVGGYNLDMLLPAGANLAHLLVGSEGTLAFSRRLELKLSTLPRHKVLGVCHFPTFYQSMVAPQHIVKLKPAAVELVDRTMIDLARSNPAFRPIVDQCVRGEPAAILLVEFAGEDLDTQRRGLKQLVDLMGELGFPEGVVEVVEPALQRDFWEVRKAGLNIMMSMKGDGKPVSFIEDCAVPLEHLAEYTDQLTQVFAKYHTEGTWYAHASVGCLHVRPILDMRREGASQMRAIAEEAAVLVQKYKGSYSGEHGDGLVRSEWIEPFFGQQLVAAFTEIKDVLDPKGLLNPGKIIRPTRQDDRSLFRYKPGYQVQPLTTVLDWREWGGFDKAVEMCNNNGHCRKFDAGTMCPSYRVTRDEQHLTRGRANTLRLALSGQLGPDALTSSAVTEAMDLCVSCKGCRRECPTGIDMAKMKIEYLHHHHRHHGISLKERLIAYLPHYAHWAAQAAPLLNVVQEWVKPLLGFAALRSMPQWRTDFWRVSERPTATAATVTAAREVVLFVDTFSTYFDPENVRAAYLVLTAAGYTVHLPVADGEQRPLCCGRTFLAGGLVEQARAEAQRLLAAVQPFVARGVPIVGLEPSCLLTLRDEFLSLLPGADAKALAAQAVLFEEFIAQELTAGRWHLPLKALPQSKALVHGHCHQKAFAAMPAVAQVLALIPHLNVEFIESSCCGMAGSFGYEDSHYAVSMQMAELSLLPKLRESSPSTLIVADGTSCRHQIRDGVAREAQHVARVLAAALA